MRTIKNNWINRIVSQVRPDNGREWIVSGTIALIQDELYLNRKYFNDALSIADRESPWCDPDPSGLNAGLDFIQDHHPKKEYSCNFYIQPDRIHVAKGQIYAYDKYLSTLAKKLADMKLRGVTEVRSTIKVQKTTRFFC